MGTAKIEVNFRFLTFNKETYLGSVTVYFENQVLTYHFTYETEHS